MWRPVPLFIVAGPTPAQPLPGPGVRAAPPTLHPRTPPVTDLSSEQAARALGWTSFAIAAVEVAAPGWLSEPLGLGEHDGLLSALGVWARVAGDAMDLALLGAAARRTTRPQGVAVAAALVAGITVLDVLCALRLRRPTKDDETMLRADA